MRSDSSAWSLVLDQSALSLRESSGSSPVFSQSTEGLEPEELGNFGTAWAEAVSLCLERRMMAGGNSLGRSWGDWQSRWGWTSSVT